MVWFKLPIMEGSSKISPIMNFTNWNRFQAHPSTTTRQQFLFEKQQGWLVNPKQHPYSKFAIALPDARPIAAHVDASTNIAMMVVIGEQNPVVRIPITDIMPTAVTKDAGQTPKVVLAIAPSHVLFQHEEQDHRGNEQSTFSIVGIVLSSVILTTLSSLYINK